MKYSVLMTVYKSDNPEYFSCSIKSMINQTKKPDEIIIVKDGPVPETIEKVIENAIQENIVPIIPVQLSENVGLGLALNEGLKYCKNELIARMDSDDISLPSRCEKQIMMFEEDKELDIVGCPVKEFVGDPTNIVGERNVPLTDKEIYKYAKRRDPFNHPTVMYKKSRVLQFGPYGNYRKNQDTALWIDMLANGCKCANLNEHLLLFRFDENTYRKRKSWLNTKLLIKIRKKAWKMGFCSFWDYAVVAIMQLGLFIMPIGVQRFVYKKFLRK